MPKHEKGTPKEIANRHKSKGLQKLKWFCQMCQKQCRDQNGFKCHLMSEAHQRQMLLFAENQNSYLRQFSHEFEANFLHILRHSFGGKRVKANDVYQEYIKDKGHIHMNSTVWHTLTGFVVYLGKSGKCKIEENEKGWFITYINQEEELKKQKSQQRAKQEKDDEERMNDHLQRQIDRARQLQGDNEPEKREPQELIRNDESKITFSLGGKKPLIETKATFSALCTPTNVLNAKSSSNLKEKTMQPSTSSSTSSNVQTNLRDNKASHKRKSALEEIMKEEGEAMRNKRDLKKFWLNK
uniref:DNA/RNA-binding protein Kin17 WH-like domain-containing protein n=1 Tax=Meloidogyne incognita TaxID=6306 RepID=A0A914KFP4_MELIC